MKIETFYTVYFYSELNTGKMPVKEWLLSLTKQDRKVIGDDLLVLQFSWPIGMPLVKSMGKGLWELRSKLFDKEARMFFVEKQQKIVVLHGFIKKSQKTPIKELELALQRLKKLTLD